MADGGYTATLEYRHPVSARAELFAFVDHGGMAPYGYRGLIPGDIAHTSVGVDVDIRPMEFAAVSLVFALPLSPNDIHGTEPVYLRANMTF